MAIKISNSTIIDDSRQIVNAGIITATKIVGTGLSISGIGTVGDTLKVGIAITASAGIITATTFKGTLEGDVTGTLQTASQPNITSVGTLSSLDVTGNVSIGGTLTYEDVTNIDSVGLVTAREGIHVVSGAGVSIADGGLNVTSGIATILDTLEVGIAITAHAGVITATTFDGSLATTNLSGSITNAQLANDSVSYGGVSVDLGASDATPAFDLSDATNYPYTSLTGIVTHIVGDTTPQLGGDLDGNSKSIYNVGVLTVTQIADSNSQVGAAGSVLSSTGTGLSWVDNAGYTNSNVDSHLNQSNPTSGYVLSWTGSDYAWVAQSGGGGGGGASGVWETNTTGINTSTNVGIGTTTASDATLTIDVGTASTALVVQGSEGNLFSVTNSLSSGSIFSVNDISGIPSIDVDADGTIQLAPFSSTEYVGFGTTNPTSKIHVVGGAKITGVLTTGQIADSNGSVGAASSVLSSTGTGLSWVAQSGGGGGGGASGVWETNATGINTSTNVGIGTTTASDATLTVDVGTGSTALIVQGSEGQLFSVTNSLSSGSIFSVNDISGIPSIDVDADGTIQLAPFSSTEYVGFGITNPTAKLHVIGDVKIGTAITASSGIITATSFVGDLTGNVTGNADTATTAGTVTTAAQPNITSLGTLTSLTVQGNVSVGGTLTYEDVTNVDSVGIVTARSGVVVVGGGVSIADGGLNVTSGITTFQQVLIGTSDAGHSSADDLTINNSGNGGITIRTGTSNNGAIFFADSTSGDARFDGFVQYNHGTNPYMIFGTATDERLRITSGGQIGIQKTPKEWNDDYRSLQIHDAGYIAGSTDDSFVAIGANNYLNDSGNYAYTNSDFASQLYQVNGELLFRNAASGTADNDVTWTERARITSSGQVAIGTVTAETNFLTTINGDLSLGEKNGADNTFIDQKQDGDLHIINSGRTSNGGSGTPGTAGVGINRYNTIAGGTTYHRDFTVYNGKDSKVLVVDGSAGAVGIGSDTPRAKFDVRPGGHSGDGAIIFTTGLGEVGSSNNAIQSIKGDASALRPLGYRATEHIFAIQSEEVLRITSSGNATFAGIVTAQGARFTDDGTDSPIVSIQTDDANPKGLQIGNSSYDASLVFGLNLYSNNAGEGYFRHVANAAYKDYHFYLDDDSSAKLCLKFESEDQSVELYTGGSKKLETTTTGAVVTGILTATSFIKSGGTGSQYLMADGTTSTGSGGGGGADIGISTNTNYIGTGVTNFNFVGTGITASLTAGASADTVANVFIPSAVRKTTRFVATANQTTFTGLNYSVGYVDVFLNGIKLDGQDEFTATNGTSVVLTDGATVNDIVEIVAQKISANLTITGIANVVEDISPELGGNLDVNGKDISGTGNVNLTGIITATTFSGTNINGGTFSGNVDLSGLLKEGVNVTAGKLSDNTSIDLANGMVHLFTTEETTTSTPDLVFGGSSVNAKMNTGEAITVVIITTADATGYSAQLTIDSGAATEQWLGGSAPSEGGADGYDVYTHNIIKTADATFLVLSNLVNFT